MSNSDRVNVPASRQSLRMLFDSAMDGFAAEDEYRQQWQGDTGLSFPADRHELNVIAIRLGLDPQATHAAGELLELARAQAVAGDSTDIDDNERWLKQVDVARGLGHGKNSKPVQRLCDSGKLQTNGETRKAKLICIFSVLKYCRQEGCTFTFNELEF